jgi:hypothetical protein
VFNVASVSYSESQGVRGVMVAQCGHWGIGCGELGPIDGECGAHGFLWTGRAGDQRLGRGERPQIKADRAGCACEVNHSDVRVLRRGGVRVLRRGGVRVRDGKKIRGRGKAERVSGHGRTRLSGR